MPHHPAKLIVRESSIRPHRKLLRSSWSKWFFISGHAPFTFYKPIYFLGLSVL
jgi:hypothetical protein